jgi:hypothetical protein
LFTVNSATDKDVSVIGKDDIITTMDSNGKNCVTIPSPSSTVQRFDFNGVLLFRPIMNKETNSQMMEVSFKM